MRATDENIKWSYGRGFSSDKNPRSYSFVRFSPPLFLSFFPFPTYSSRISTFSSMSIMIAERQTARNHRASHKLVRGTLLKSNSTEILFTASCLAASILSLFEHQRFVGRLAGKYLRVKWNANFHSRRATLHCRLICSKKNKISSIRPCDIYYDDPSNWCGTTWQNNDCIFERQLHLEIRCR